MPCHGVSYWESTTWWTQWNLKDLIKRDKENNWFVLTDFWKRAEWNHCSTEFVTVTLGTSRIKSFQNLQTFSGFPQTAQPGEFVSRLPRYRLGGIREVREEFVGFKTVWESRTLKRTFTTQSFKRTVKRHSVRGESSPIVEITAPLHTLCVYGLTRWQKGGVIVTVVSIVSRGGEVCIAYTSVLVNLWDPTHILGYLYQYCSIDKVTEACTRHFQ